VVKVTYPVHTLTWELTLLTYAAENMIAAYYTLLLKKLNTNTLITTIKYTKCIASVIKGSFILLCFCIYYNNLLSYIYNDKIRVYFYIFDFFQTTIRRINNFLVDFSFYNLKKL